MPRVAVEEEAFNEPRVLMLVHLTPSGSVNSIICRLIRLWFHVCRTQTMQQPRRVVAYIMKWRSLESVQAMIDVGLALEVDARLVDLPPLSKLFTALPDGEMQ